MRRVNVCPRLGIEKIYGMQATELGMGHGLFGYYVRLLGPGSEKFWDEGSTM